MNLVGEKDSDGNIIQDDREYKSKYKHSLEDYVKENYNYWESERGLAPAANEGKVITPFKRDKPKISRNSPCSCGSGKKYKKCCGRSGPETLH